MHRRERQESEGGGALTHHLLCAKHSVWLSEVSSPFFRRLPSILSVDLSFFHSSCESV